MMKAAVLGFALLFSCAWLQAQDQTPQTQSPQTQSPETQPPQGQSPDMQSPQTQPPTDPSDQTSAPSQTPNGGQTTVKGCVRIAKDRFTLVDDSGNKYDLAGDTSTMNDHVGHQVQITGTVVQPDSNSTNTSVPQGSAMSQQTTLSVAAVQELSTECAGGSK
jgi:cytoskeletal protein RodZ